MREQHKKKKSGIIIKILAIFSSLVVLSLIAGGCLFFYYAKDAPKLSEAKLSSTASSTFYDKNNELFADLGSENRELVTPQEIPQTLVDAIVSVEDKRFYKHIGIDPIRIVGSVIHNLTHSSTQGGSTLTQQLIKLSYFTTNTSDQTLKRKAQEAWLAIQLERRNSKVEILSYYINKVYMGNRFYGMQTAAKNYYGKELTQLSLPQLALLAGIPQAPSQYDPYTQPEEAKKRRDTVLLTMYENDKISKAEYQAALNTPINDGLVSFSQDNSKQKIVDNYLKQVIEEVEEKTGKDVETSGMKIYTNLDMDAQTQLYQIANTTDYVAWPNDDMQVASTVVDVNTGKVVAQIGARKVPENTTFGNNQAVLTDRDFGSTMKPLVDYGPAFDSGTYTSTGQIVSDSLAYYPNTNTQIYNWDLKYMGNMTVRNALVLSRNVPAIKTLEAVGLDVSKSYLDKLNLNFPELVYANAISSSNSAPAADQTYGASSLKMAAAYATFSNGGTYYQPYYVNKVTYSDGTSQDFSSTGNRVFKETTAYIITDILKDVISQGMNTGTNAQISGLEQAGKTGTSNYTEEELAAMGYSGSESIVPDETFVGYSRTYAVSVWTGYQNKLTPLYTDDLILASDVYREMMTYLSANDDGGDWEMPNGISKRGNELYLNINAVNQTSTDGTTYTVKSGEGIAQISQNTGVSIDKLLELNGFSSQSEWYATPGQKIKIK
ncbi:MULTISPECIES: PBP1A family penicillin-binding protein [unclassified Enterococcus]|uniref:PBP1A family penicillin-binding protein n=1 Tax=unclassified Enterococcus TaxID=2608891 RepID=UPI00155223F7|nr:MULTISPECIES: PBP1A family penicillin-binding protein [unclassified Enterococcus]MBS7577416.1 PBP1A family penicillin-binding protein [Enterococcus sp. MMGLQ5-2]MBS7584823.1 PBP1A family penicillin-binding protein [Enterococcus sp. MMGLQ5-1]NPD12678.1 PBP1A family penicillin-binding protein [Enterococcus sp. MMGLQ5-1]NPD37250.1 PBP1A family penicillin-binding protein [Enterococcus sp. MMGLQ5-2]